MKTKTNNKPKTQQSCLAPVSGSHSFKSRWQSAKLLLMLIRLAKRAQKLNAKWEGRRFDLIETKRQPESQFNWDAVLEIGISGQDALTVKQLFTMERLFKNQKDWKVKLAIWLIGRTPL